VPGSKDRIEALTSVVSSACARGDWQAADEAIAEADVHDVGGVLKVYFRRLPEPLFPFDVYEETLAIADESDAAVRLTRVCKVVADLPAPNHALLSLLITFLARVAEHSAANMMTSSNLSIVFGPGLLRPREEGVEYTFALPRVNGLVELMIDGVASLFPDEAEATTTQQGDTVAVGSDSESGSESDEDDRGADDDEADDDDAAGDSGGTGGSGGGGGGGERHRRRRRRPGKASDEATASAAAVPAVEGERRHRQRRHRRPGDTSTSDPNLLSSLTTSSSSATLALPTSTSSTDLSTPTRANKSKRSKQRQASNSTSPSPSPTPAVSAADAPAAPPPLPSLESLPPPIDVKVLLGKEQEPISVEVGPALSHEGLRALLPLKGGSIFALAPSGAPLGLLASLAPMPWAALQVGGEGVQLALVGATEGGSTDKDTDMD